MRRVNNSVETVNAAATAIVSAETRVQPTSVEQSQANQVHKELQGTMQQLEAIRHEIRSISILNPGPLTRRLVDNPELTSANSANSGNGVSPQNGKDQRPPEPISKESGSTTSTATDLQSQSTAYARLAESQLKNNAFKGLEGVVKPGEETDLFNILPVSAESAGLLPDRKGLSLVPDK